MECQLSNYCRCVCQEAAGNRATWKHEKPWKPEAWQSKKVHAWEVDAMLKGLGQAWNGMDSNIGSEQRMTQNNSCLRSRQAGTWKCKRNSKRSKRETGKWLLHVSCHEEIILQGFWNSNHRRLNCGFAHGKLLICCRHCFHVATSTLEIFQDNWKFGFSPQMGFSFLLVFESTQFQTFNLAD